MLSGFTAAQYVNLGDIAGGVTVSASKPADQTHPWLMLDTLGRPTRLYFFSQGAWLSLHPLSPGMTVWYFDVAPDFTIYDGGDALAPSALSGPMWQLALLPNGTPIAAQFPIVAGTLASTTVLVPGDVGGEETHLLIGDENGVPAHTHPISQIRWSPTHGFIDNTGSGAGTTGAVPVVTDASDKVEAAKAHNNMPPFAVGLLLQRTSRLFFTIAA
jgi:hypothetical protein